MMSPALSLGQSSLRAIGLHLDVRVSEKRRREEQTGHRDLRLRGEGKSRFRIVGCTMPTSYRSVGDTIAK